MKETEAKETTREPKDEMTREQFELFSKTTIESIDIQLPMMLKQLEYQKVVTELEELRARYLRAQQVMANIMAPPPDPMENHKESKTEAALKRELKKESA